MSSKRYIALSLLVLISFKSLVVPFIYLDFELRKEYIIQSLCENRFNPQLHCDGKCYLAKQLKKVAQEHARDAAQKQSESTKKLLLEIFEVLPSGLHLEKVFHEKTLIFFYFHSSIQKGFTLTPLMPPIA